MKTYFVVRDTNHPQSDLDRNWSSYLGGSLNGEDGGDTEAEAIQNYADFIGIEVDDVTEKFRYHPAYERFVIVHYDGLGAEELAASTIEEALEEERDLDQNHLGFCAEKGSGHFLAEDCVGFTKVREGRYVFEIKG